LCKMSVCCSVFCVFISNFGSAVNELNRHLKIYTTFPQYTTIFHL
jgi:hypothetical protein